MDLLKRVFMPVEQTALTSVGLLILRVFAGYAFILHGWGKIQNPFGWMGPEAPVPGIFQGLAALAEFGGGIAWILGLVTPLASFGMLCTMTVAAAFHLILRGDPLIASGPGASAEPAVVYWCVSVLFLTAGPGRFAADRAIFGPRQ
jgi:putative oxidoreductase